MMRYAILNGVVLALICVWTIRQRDVKAMHALLKKTVMLISALTVVFDPLIIAAGIVAYHRNFTLGITFFGAPVEDIAYALAAGIVIPLLWKQYETR